MINYITCGSGVDRCHEELARLFREGDSDNEIRHRETNHALGPHRPAGGADTRVIVTRTSEQYAGFCSGIRLSAGPSRRRMDRLLDGRTAVSDERLSRVKSAEIARQTARSFAKIRGFFLSSVLAMRTPNEG